MKKIYSLLILIMASLGLYKAQMTITQTGNVVNFSYTIDPSVWNSTPINLYAYVESSSASNGEFKKLLGSWPGTKLSGTGPYTASVDLSTLYSAGVTISEIKYIYNYGSYQNPSSGGFKATSAGFTQVTISSTLGTIENASKTKSFFSEGKLYTSQKGNLDIQVYDFSGKLVKKLNANNVSSGLELNLPKKGNYLVKVNNEVVKIAY
mgnify:FL=1